MSSSGTLISELDSSPSLDGDGDLIKRIMADVNSSGVLPPPSPAPSINVVNSPNPNSTFQHAMDNVPATAHIIGKDHPSSGDFQAAIQHTGGYAPSGPTGYAGNPMPMMQQAAWQAPPSPPVLIPEPRKWSSFIFDEVKMPILVSLLVFVFSLPILNIVIATYVPYLVKSTGDLTTFGLILKSLLAGSTFWILQRIVVPLLSL
jgi:hypothetical protein